MQPGGVTHMTFVCAIGFFFSSFIQRDLSLYLLKLVEEGRRFCWVTSL